MTRLAQVKPFLVMDILRKARTLPNVVHFEVGQPDIPPSPDVVQALTEAVQNNCMQYTESLGILELREKISAFYKKQYNVDVSPERIALTVGTSGAFLVSYSVLLNAGDRLLLTDPAYPCYKNFSHILNVEPVSVPVDESTRYELTIEQLKAQKNIKAVQISSPANPIGNIYSKESLHSLISYCDEEDIYFISDEIYHGLNYEEPTHTALEFSDNAIVINGFSKYFSLPGLRLGWVILPEKLIRSAEIVLQNLYISPPTLSQYAALAAFNYDYLEQCVEVYKQRRDYLYTELQQLFTVDAKPQGAFYIWANISKYSDDSLAFAEELLDTLHIATTSGVDFGEHNTKHYLRFAYTRDLEHLEKGMERLKNYLATRPQC